MVPHCSPKEGTKDKDVLTVSAYCMLQYILYVAWGIVHHMTSMFNNKFHLWLFVTGALHISMHMFSNRRAVLCAYFTGRWNATLCQKAPLQMLTWEWLRMVCNAHWLHAALQCYIASENYPHFMILLYIHLKESKYTLPCYFLLISLHCLSLFTVVRLRKRRTERGRLKAPSTSAITYWSIEKQREPLSGEQDQTVGSGTKLS